MAEHKMSEVTTVATVLYLAMWTYMRPVQIFEIGESKAK